MTSNSLLLAKKQLPVQNYAELIRTLLFKRSSVQSTPHTAESVPAFLRQQK